MGQKAFNDQVPFFIRLLHMDDGNIGIDRREKGNAVTRIPWVGHDLIFLVRGGRPAVENVGSDLRAGGHEWEAHFPGQKATDHAEMAVIFILQLSRLDETAPSMRGAESL
jgi:hypothetical protein